MTVLKSQETELKAVRRKKTCTFIIQCNFPTEMKLHSTPSTVPIFFYFSFIFQLMDLLRPFSCHTEFRAKLTINVNVMTKIISFKLVFTMIWHVFWQVYIIILEVKAELCHHINSFVCHHMSNYYVDLSIFYVKLRDFRQKIWLLMASACFNITIFSFLTW